MSSILLPIAAPRPTKKPSRFGLASISTGAVRDRLKRHRSKSSLWDTRLHPNADFRRLRRRLQRSITIATSAAAAEIHSAAREKWPDGETDASRFIPGCRGRPASPDGEETRPEPPEFPTGDTRLRPGMWIFIGVASDCPDLPDLPRSSPRVLFPLRKHYIPHASDMNFSSNHQPL